ncbi:hypothetical protein SAMN05216410_0974 [Sanguibacter gelidistatuariae]|uniref:DoxX protein n=1 Tax=Sanguibacter gelidistatuariae TaxID=1814289 RepID=A0A1G6HF26_9MICO|nr:hypothetical protein [Sanguibacter gelidistatuariae]SDB92821.1 hypothetical protein SAMN05216410_0974 [Sanguibacter gelidistatuariae]
MARLLRRLPLRLAAGAFVLNSGIGKVSLDADSAKGLQSMGANILPQLRELDPEAFGKLLSRGEIAVGAALLAPFVPTAVAGIALTGFAGALVGMYLRTPGMTQPDGVRPTQQGIALAKDVWLLAIGLSLTIDGLTSRKR